MILCTINWITALGLTFHIQIVDPSPKVVKIIIKNVKFDLLQDFDVLIDLGAVLLVDWYYSYHCKLI